MSDHQFKANGPDSDISLIMMSFEPETIERLATATPQTVYAEIMEKAPYLRRTDRHVTLLKMVDVTTVNRQRTTLGNGMLESSMGGTRKLIPLDVDGDVHRRFRRLLDPVFAPKRMALLEPQIRVLAEALIDDFVDVGSTEIFSSFCQPLPSRIFLSVMGIPLSDLDDFLAFKDGILRHDPNEPVEDVHSRREAAGAMGREYFSSLWNDRHNRDDDAQDIISWLIASEVDGRRLDVDEFVDVCFMLTMAGLDTVSASLSCMISWLARHPDARRRIVQDPQLWPGAIEELLRIETPVPLGFREIGEDLELQGETFVAGTRFIVAWSAANLDPEAFAEPLVADLTRSPNRHIAFGTGYHRCLGSHLARLELRIALEELHRRIPDYQIADGADLTYIPLGARQVSELPIYW